MTGDTKRKIANGLTSMLETEPIRKITIKALVDNCGVNRQSFYYHFRDIYDLLGYAFQLNVHRFLETDGMLDAPWQDQLRALMRKFLEHRNIIIHGYEPEYRAYYDSFVQSFIYDIIAKKIEACAEASRLQPEARDFICEFFAIIGAGYIMNWVSDGMPDSILDRVDDLILLVDGSVHEMVTKFLKKNA